MGDESLAGVPGGDVPAPARDDLRRKVDALPVDVREVIFLYYYEAQSVRKVAKVMGLARKTIESMLRRGRDLLRAELWRELKDVLPDLLPAAREWKRRGRRLTPGRSRPIFVGSLTIPSPGTVPAAPRSR